MTTVSRRTAPDSGSATQTDRRRSRHTLWLLACGAAAGPLFAGVTLAQAALRDGFDIVRNPISQLSDGRLGWVQIAAFVVYGALTVAGARGLAHAVRGRPGGLWAPRLVALGGAASLVGGCFRLDPGNGFPPGAPKGPPAAMSWHSYVHLAGGSIGFAALIGACFVLGRYHARSSQPIRARLARVCGAIFVAGDIWAVCGGAGGPLTLCIGVLTGMLFISATAFALRTETDP